MARGSPALHAAGKDLVNRLRRLIAFLAGSARRVETRTGITNAQLYLLRRIRSKGGRATIGELARLSGVQQSTVSIVVGRLEKAGLVRRRRSPRDGRQVQVQLTREGSAVLARAPSPPTERLIQALSALTPANRRGLDAGLQALERALGTQAMEPSMLFEPGVQGPARAGTLPTLSPPAWSE